MHQKARNVKMSKVTKGHIHEVFFRFIQKLLRLYAHFSTRFQGSSLISIFRYFADKISSIFFQRAITQKRCIVLMGKNVSAILEIHI